MLECADTLERHSQLAVHGIALVLLLLVRGNDCFDLFIGHVPHNDVVTPMAEGVGVRHACCAQCFGLDFVQLAHLWVHGLDDGLLDCKRPCLCVDGRQVLDDCADDGLLGKFVQFHLLTPVNLF